MSSTKLEMSYLPTCLRTVRTRHLWRLRSEGQERKGACVLDSVPTCLPKVPRLVPIHSHLRFTNILVARL